jgi:hypothetical protein
MQRLKLVIPTMIVVAILSMWILKKDHTAVPFHYQVLITLGAAILSGVLTSFLFKNEGNEKKMDK